MIKIRKLHSWHLSINEAKNIQYKLANKVCLQNSVNQVNTIAGVDVSIYQNIGTGAIVILTYPDFKIIEKIKVKKQIDFPYIPGLLSFREIPILLQAFRKLTIIPDIILVDGQGIAHPRRFGLASHLGLILNMPTIGCAKSLLCGYCTPPGIDRGSYTEIIDNKQIIGVSLRTKTNIKPIFISIGNKINLSTAIHWTLQSSLNYRIPEALRLAHLASRGKI